MVENKKRCNKCKKELYISDFYKNRGTKDGLTTICKYCLKIDYNPEKRKERYELNKNVELEKSKQYYLKNRDKVLERCNKYNNEHKIEKRIKSKVYRENNKDKIKAYNDIYVSVNKDKINKKQREKYANNSTFRLNANISGALSTCLKGAKSEKHWEDIVGYTLEELKQHLESQFDKSMTWDNYGTYWELDHIIPKNLFNYSTIQDIEFKICWSLTNLRPLEKIANKSRPKDGRDIDVEKVRTYIMKKEGLIC